MDRIIRCITHDGSMMIAAVDTTLAVATAQQVHKMTATTTAALGRTLTAASIMGAMLKSEKSTVTIKFAGNGPIGSIVAVSDSKGNVRGYVQNPRVDLPVRIDGKLDVGTAVGKEGRMCVIKDFGSGEPYIGQTEIVTGEIAEDITSYYATSEQVPTVCALGVLTDKDTHKAILSGGLLIQVLPGAYDSDITKLEEDLQSLEPMTTMLAKGMTLEEICKSALKSFDVDKLDETSIHYACTCSKQKYANALITLGASELETLPMENEKVETVCPYCDKHYYFTKEEIEVLINQAN
ncbi:MAG: Hsp33 family molecular chaperone HslO [Clostridia bacterium]